MLVPRQTVPMQPSSSRVREDNCVPHPTRRSDDPDRAFQGLPHTPGERYADKGPEQHRSGVKPAFANAERALVHPSLALGTRGLQLSDLFRAHVPFGVDRLDEIVADQASDQHGAQDIHGGVVEVVAWDAGSELEVTD